MAEHNEEAQEVAAVAEAGKDLVLNLGGGGSPSSIPPTDPKAQRLRSLANIIATTAALLTAVAAIFKPQDQSVNRATYEQLKGAIEQTNQYIKQEHDDTVALHNYLTGYFANNTTFSPPALVSTASAASAAAPPTPAQTSAPVVINRPVRKIVDAGAPTPAATMSFYPPAAPAAAYPLPEIQSVPAPKAIPEFDVVAKKY